VRTAPAGEVARAEAGFFEEYSMEALAAGIQRYQSVGCWDGDVEIPRDLYEQALNVFQTEGGVTRRHPYEDVCLGAG
jgi:NitT/TauT family transport system substrate-binding protein